VRHALKQAIKLVLYGLSFKKLGEAFKHFFCELFAHGNELDLVVLVK
jgi:hypothetical protein